MLFSSLIFLTLFLPCVLIGSWLMPKTKYANLFLLLASLLFYAWGEPIYIFLMLFSIFSNWLLGLAMEQFPARKRLVLIIAIAFNLALLGYFKYFNLLMDILRRLTHSAVPDRAIALPIGISFYTFQILSYIIDLYRGRYRAQRNLVSLALYVSLFPQLIAGPIVKYADVNGQLVNRKRSLAKSSEGIRRFCYGLAKKVILANTLAECADRIFNLELQYVSWAVAWAGAVLYTLEIYYDFSGYSDMAIGLGKMLGFDFQENFRYPYVSTSIREFWRRWHISLSSWFKEYVYIPLGGSRKGKARTYRNLGVVFLATGLWHGASYNFIFWGLYHGFFSIVERLGFGRVLERHKIFAHIYTLFVVVFGWVFFGIARLPSALQYASVMLTPWRHMEPVGYTLRELVDHRAAAVLLAAILGAGIMQSLAQRLPQISIGMQRWKNSFGELLWCMLLLGCSIILLASNTYNPFIYFRF